MKRSTGIVTDRQKLDTDLLVVYLLEKLIQEQLINQATYIKTKEVMGNIEMSI